MNLYKTSFWVGISTIIKISAGLVTNKILAIFVGPTGIALLGNFTNMTTILSSFANGAIGSGTVKYIAESEKDEDKRSVVSHSLIITIICSFIIGLVALIFNKAFSQLAFGDLRYKSVISIFGLTIVFYGLNITITSILNGYKHTKYLIITSTIASIISLVLAAIITIRFGLYGALINTMIAQFIIFVVLLLFIRKIKLFKFKLLKISINKAFSWKLLKFGLMSLSSLTSIASTLIIRKHIFVCYSPNEAGYIQGVWTISSQYLMVITSSLAIYYLPTLSSLKEKKEIRTEIIKGYKFLLPIAIIGGLSIFFFRNLIIKILFTPAFAPMQEYFTFQLIGDGLKVAAWLLSYLMVAKALTRYFIASEIFFSISYVCIGLIFMHFYGSIGITYAYAINYFLYLIFLIVLFRDYLFVHESQNEYKHGC